MTKLIAIGGSATVFPVKATIEIYLGCIARKFSAFQRTTVNAFLWFAGAKFVETWAGMIDAMPEVIPVMNGVAEYTGFFIATGFSSHGFGIGPRARKVVAGLIEGKQSAHDLWRFRFSRFSNAPELVPRPDL